MQPSSSAYMPDVKRFRLGTFYDTYELAHTTAVPTQILMFQAPITAGKGIEKTNMTDSGKLPFPVNMRVMAIRAMLLGMHRTDVLNIMQKYCLRFRIGTKHFLEAPIQWFPGGGGPSGIISGAAAEQNLLTNGIPDPRAIAGVGAEYALDLPYGVPFAVELQGTSFTTTATASGGTGIYLQVYLDGLISEGVQ